jgi:hypothetical protein
MSLTGRRGDASGLIPTRPFAWEELTWRRRLCSDVCANRVDETATGEASPNPRETGSGMGGTERAT